MVTRHCTQTWRSLCHHPSSKPSFSCQSKHGSGFTTGSSSNKQGSIRRQPTVMQAKTMASKWPRKQISALVLDTSSSRLLHQPSCLALSSTASLVRILTLQVVFKHKAGCLRHNTACSNTLTVWNMQQLHAPLACAILLPVCSTLCIYTSHWCI